MTQRTRTNNQPQVTGCWLQEVCHAGQALHTLALASCATELSKICLTTTKYPNRTVGSAWEALFRWSRSARQGYLRDDEGKLSRRFRKKSGKDSQPPFPGLCFEGF